MSGTKESAKKAKETMLKRNPNHYSDIAKLPRSNYPNTFKNKDIARKAGRLGGLISRKPKKQIEDTENLNEA